MSRFFQVNLVFFLVTCGPALPTTNGQPPAPDKQPPPKRVTLTELGRLYLDLELPLPPKEVGFAVIGMGLLPWQIERYPNPNDGLGPLKSDCRFQFAIEDPSIKGQYRVWAGFRVSMEKRVDQFWRTAPSPKTVLQVIKLDRLRSNFFYQVACDEELIFAMQCHLLGHEELASFFYRRCQKTAQQPLEQTLLIEAWNHWARELDNPEMDRARLAGKFKILVERHRFVSLLEEQHGATPGSKNWAEQHQELLDRLTLTLKPIYGAGANPGSAKSLIDDLVNSNPPPQPPDSLRLASDLWEGEDPIRPRPIPDSSPFQDVEQKLFLLGFDAIPLLIEHVDDRRLSRIRTIWGGGGQPTRTLRAWDFPTVGERARAILSTFFDLSRDGGSSGWKTKKADYLSAWKPMSALNESDFVAAKIASPQAINWNFLSFIKTKYPNRVIDLYRKALLEDQEFPYFQELVQFIVQSNLPRSEKMELLIEGAKNKWAYYQVYCLAGLLELDEVIFAKHWIAALSRFPTEFPKEKAACYQIYLLDLGLCCQDRPTQERVLALTQKLPIPAKIALLAELPNANYRPKKHLVLSFLARFLDDDSVYHSQDHQPFKDLNSLFRGFEKIEVRNYAANQILDILGVELPLNDQTPEDEWVRVREFVQDEVDRYLELMKPK